MLPLHASSLCLLGVGARPGLKLYGHADVATHCSLCRTAMRRCKIPAMLTQPLSAQHQLALMAASRAVAGLAQPILPVTPP